MHDIQLAEKKVIIVPGGAIDRIINILISSFKGSDMSNITHTNIISAQTFLPGAQNWLRHHLGKALGSEKKLSITNLLPIKVSLDKYGNEVFKEYQSSLYKVFVAQKLSEKKAHQNNIVNPYIVSYYIIIRLVAMSLNVDAVSLRERKTYLAALNKFTQNIASEKFLTVKSRITRKELRLSPAALKLIDTTIERNAIISEVLKLSATLNAHKIYIQVNRKTCEDLILRCKAFIIYFSNNKEVLNKIEKIYPEEIDKTLDDLHRVLGIEKEKNPNYVSGHNPFFAKRMNEIATLKNELENFDEIFKSLEKEFALMGWLLFLERVIDVSSLKDEMIKLAKKAEELFTLPKDFPEATIAYLTKTMLYPYYSKDAEIDIMETVEIITSTDSIASIVNIVKSEIENLKLADEKLSKIINLDKLKSLTKLSDSHNTLSRHRRMLISYGQPQVSDSVQSAEPVLSPNDSRTNKITK